MRSENITIKSAKLTLNKRLYTTNTPFLIYDVETGVRERGDYCVRQHNGSWEELYDFNDL